MHINVLMLGNLRNLFKVRLSKFGLLRRYDADEVINEVVVRLYKAINSGQPIPNEEAWFLATGYNYISELSRKEKKYQIVELYTVESLLAKSEQSGLTLEEADVIKFLYEALQELTQEERQLLELRYFENLSWKDISQRLAQIGESVTSDALRQRRQRVIKRLKEVFFKKFLP